jgi:hypothetical protein
MRCASVSTSEPDMPVARSCFLIFCRICRCTSSFCTPCPSRRDRARGRFPSTGRARGFPARRPPTRPATSRSRSPGSAWLGGPGPRARAHRPPPAARHATAVGGSLFGSACGWRRTRRHPTARKLLWLPHPFNLAVRPPDRWMTERMLGRRPAMESDRARRGDRADTSPPRDRSTTSSRNR